MFFMNEMGRNEQYGENINKQAEDIVKIKVQEIED